MVERRTVDGVGPGEPGPQPDVRHAVDLCRARVSILHRERADAIEAVGRGRGVVGDPVVVDAARRDRELRVADAAQREAEAGIEHGDVDALGVEHLHSFARVEAGRMQVLVVHPPPIVLV